MSHSKAFSEVEWSLIKRTPLLVFYFVASADDNVEAHEVEKMISHFEDPHHYKSSVFTEVVSELMSDPSVLHSIGSEILELSGEAINATISKVQALVDVKLDPAEAGPFKEALVALGTDIAAATGDTDLPISKQEWTHVTTLKKLLNL